MKLLYRILATLTSPFRRAYDWYQFRYYPYTDLKTGEQKYRTASEAWDASGMFFYWTKFF